MARLEHLNTAFATLMGQGGLLLWVLFAVAVLMVFLVLQRWLTWRQPPACLPARMLQVPVTGRPDLRRRVASLRLLNHLEAGLPLLKALVTITPLLGLTGTVTGMMLVFDGLSLGAAADPRQLASGIARAILPTFVSMAVAVVGLFFVVLWQRRLRRCLQEL